MKDYFIAAQNGNQDVVDLLVTYKADRSLADANGMTALKHLEKYTSKQNIKSHKM